MMYPKRYYTAILTAYALLLCAGYVQSSSLFIPPNLSRNMVYEQALSRYFADHVMLDAPADTFLCVASATPLYGKTRHPDSLAQILLPGQGNSVTIAQDGFGDIWSGWLGLICPEETPFSSVCSFSPVRTVYGAHLNAYINLDHTYEGLWANIAAFAGVARHELAFEEKDVHNQGCSSTHRSVRSYLKGVAWESGIISTEPLQRTGLDDIFAKLGYSWYWGDENLFSVYAAGSIPTARDRKMTRLFEPVLGSPFWYAGGGARLDMGTWWARELFINVMLDGWYIHGFAATEHRLCDLNGRGQWSRYLSCVRNTQEPELIPGPNVLFVPATVNPGRIAQLLAAMHIEYYTWHFETGYLFWHRGGEHISRIQLDDDVGIAYLPDVQEGVVRTASQATINSLLTSALADNAFRFIQASDLDISSASAKSASAHTLYAAAMYTTTLDGAPFGIGLGGQYQYARSTSVPSQWSVWAKVMLGF